MVPGHKETEAVWVLIIGGLSNVHLMIVVQDIPLQRVRVQPVQCRL